MDLNTILSMKYVQLKETLRGFNLGVSGRKDVLRNRLLQHYNLAQIDDSEEETQGTDDDIISERHDENPEEAEEVEEDAEVENAEIERKLTGCFRTHFTLKDVQDSLNDFSGTDGMKVEAWIQELEDVASTIEWNDLQRFVYSKQLLKGAAKAYVRSQTNITSWFKLKKALREEFQEAVSAAEVHRALKAMQKKDGETLLEFLYAIIEKGKNIELDERSVIEYFVEGVPDSRVSKLMLYQATTIKSLKDAIKVYEKVRTPAKSSYLSGTRANVVRSIKSESKKEEPVRRNCYNCGETSHLARDCTKKQMKCFKCNDWGHRSYECPQKDIKSQKTTSETKANANMMSSNNKTDLIFKPVSIEDHVTEALIDTGCVVSIVRYDTLLILGAHVKIQSDEMRLRGIGENEIITLGSFVGTVSADGLRFPVKFYVVPERGFSYNVILGKNILNNIDLSITKSRTIFHKRGEVTTPKTKTISKSVLVKAGDESGGENSLEEWWKVNDALCTTIENEVESHVQNEVEVSHLSLERANEIRGIIQEYLPIKKKNVSVEMKLTLSDDNPISQRSRRLAQSEEKIVDKIVQKWQDEGVVRPSNSEYCSPVVLVRKKNNSHRLCCDYRLLNKKIINADH